MRQFFAALLFVLTFAFPAFAAGPRDGFYAVVETLPSGAQIFYYTSLHQNDNFLSQGFNVVVTSVEFGNSWTIGLGVLSGNSVGNGNFFDYLGRFMGTFSGAFIDPIHLQGQIHYVNGVVTRISAERIF